MTYDIARLLEATQIVHEEISALTALAHTREARAHDPLREHLTTLRRLRFELRQAACDVHVATDAALEQAVHDYSK